MNTMGKIHSVLLKNGVMPNVKGYRYCADILLLLVAGTTQMNKCYQKVAQKYGILPNSIEKSVVNAIEKAFGRCEIQQKYALLCLDSGKVSNKKFFSLMLKELLKTGD